jgi:predicted RecA/RadA family phage recombinase
MGAAYFADGDLIDYTPSAAVAVGDVVVIGDTVTVAVRPIAANTLGAVAVEGVFTFPKATGSAIGQGVIVYWDATNGVITATAGSNKRAGKVAAAAASSDTTVKVVLNLV